MLTGPVEIIVHLTDMTDSSRDIWKTKHRSKFCRFVILGSAPVPLTIVSAVVPSGRVWRNVCKGNTRLTIEM
jgi:hypothetical protein